MGLGAGWAIAQIVAAAGSAAVSVSTASKTRRAAFLAERKKLQIDTNVANAAKAKSTDEQTTSIDLTPDEEEAAALKAKQGRSRLQVKKTPTRPNVGTGLSIGK